MSEGKRCNGSFKPLHLLVINWRDIRSSWAGGAELYCHEIFSRIAQKGHCVTLLTSSFPGGSSEEEIGGVHIIRQGQWYNANLVLPLAARKYLKQHQVDLVIDDMNKVPFFTPLYFRHPTIVLLMHLWGRVIFQEVPVPQALYVYLQEKLIPLIYRQQQWIVISDSTRDELVRLGINPRHVKVVHCGLDHSQYHLDPKESKFEEPTILVISRLRRYKGIQFLLKALRGIVRAIPELHCYIVGDGPYREKLRGLASRLGVAKYVTFSGRLPEAEKTRLLRKSHLLVNPSLKEGWGLVNIEANACGLPVVAADSPGLRNSVIQEVGVLYPPKDTRALQGTVIRLLSDQVLWDRMSQAALRWARRFSWGMAAEQVLTCIQDETARISKR